MKNVNNILKKIYNNVQLNLGIKSFFKIFFDKIGLFCDQFIIYPIYKKSEKYVFDKVIKHYRADYKWNDQKSQNLEKKQLTMAMVCFIIQ